MTKKDYVKIAAALAGEKPGIDNGARGMSRKRLPSTDWTSRTPAERRALLDAPFPLVTRIPGKTWAGTIVVDDTDDPVLRHYKGVRESTTDNTFDNLVKHLEG